MDQLAMRYYNDLMRTEDGSTVFERFETKRALPAGA